METTPKNVLTTLEPLPEYLLDQFNQEAECWVRSIVAVSNDSLGLRFVCTQKTRCEHPCILARGIEYEEA